MEKLNIIILNLLALVTFFATMFLILGYVFASVASKIKALTEKKYMILIIGLLFDLIVYYFYYKVLLNELSFELVATFSDMFDVTVLLLLHALLIIFFGFHFNQLYPNRGQKGVNEKVYC